MRFQLIDMEDCIGKQLNLCFQFASQITLVINNNNHDIKTNH
jgi:hypothetical protein